MVQDPAGWEGGQNYLNNYCYNIHPAYFGPAGGPYVYQPWWKLLSKYGKAPQTAILAQHNYTGVQQPVEFGWRRFALATCPLISPSTGPTGGYAPHRVKSDYAINLLFADGSVQTAIVPPTVIRSNIINWNRFLDVVIYAEMSVAGQGTAGTFYVSSTNPYNYLPINPRPH
jgi:prepilin-type processing-associated H-X9-DG protein